AALTEFLRRQYIACLALALKRLFDLSTGPEHQQWGSLGVHQGPHHGPRSPPASSICASFHVDYILPDACLCFSEVIRSNYSLLHGIWWDSCCICNSKITDSSFKCRTCYEIFICLDCHANYIKSGRRAPESFEALERLEREVTPVILALNS